tara:strand:- start:213 stop:614 length:402 start_codon:yes stop_codon:yes gene_type:complete
MATTTAKLTITSSDLIDSQALNLSASMTMKKAGGSIGLENTSGLARKKLASGHGSYVLFDDTLYTDAGNNRLYLRAVGTTATEYFDISLQAVNFGRLYSGDWCLLPWLANADMDINIDPSAAGMTLEYMLFYE